MQGMAKSAVSLIRYASNFQRTVVICRQSFTSGTLVTVLEEGDTAEFSSFNSQVR